MQCWQRGVIAQMPGLIRMAEANTAQMRVDGSMAGAGHVKQED